MEELCAETTMWEISYDEKVGRLLVATQDIEPEEIVLEDTCLIAAPDGFPACLGCLGGVDGRYSCPSCFCHPVVQMSVASHQLIR